MSSNLPPYVPPSPFTPFLRRFTDEIARDISETRALYNGVRAEHMASAFAEDGILDRIHGILAQDIIKAVGVPSYVPLVEALDTVIASLLADEKTIFDMPKIEWDIATLSMKEHDTGVRDGEIESFEYVNRN